MPLTEEGGGVGVEVTALGCGSCGGYFQQTHVSAGTNPTSWGKNYGASGLQSPNQVGEGEELTSGAVSEHSRSFKVILGFHN